MPSSSRLFLFMILVTFLSTFTVSCGGDSTQTTAPSLIEGELNNLPIAFRVESARIVPSGLLGISVTLSNQSNGATNTNVESGELQLSIFINNINAIQPNVETQVGGGNNSISFTFETEQELLIGTAGVLTLSQVSRIPGDTVAGTFSLLFSSFSFENPQSATLSGAFESVIEVSEP